MKHWKQIFAVVFIGTLLLAQQPINVSQVAGTAPSTAGKIDIKALDGDVFVRSNAGSTFPVNATLSAETTKVLGVVRTADGAGNLFTTNSTVTAGKFALDFNLLSILGTAPTAAGKLDVKSAAGDLNATLAAETTKVIGTVRVVGNSGTALDSTAGVLDQNLKNVGGNTVLTGNGTTGTGSQRVTIASDQTGFDVTPVPTATSGDTALRCILVSAASTNSTNCKNAAGNVYGFRFVNTTGTIYYLRMYNASSAPTCSSATGFIESIPIPASTSGAGIVAMEPSGEGYSTGIGFCFTGGSSSTDNTNAAVGVFGTILYK